MTTAPATSREAPATGASRSTPQARSSLRRRLGTGPGLHVGVIGGMLLLSVFMWWRVWVTGHPSSTLTCQCGDVSEALGFLAWAPWAVIHGHNPFLSNAVYAGQGGANMLTNASFIVGSLVFAPITWLFGPVATLNVMMTVAPVLSGWCCFIAVRRFTRFVPGQVAAAFLYGFAPIVVANDRLGHFFQVWLFYPPLVFVVFYDLLVTRRRSALRSGVILGVLTVIEFFTSTEILVITVLVGAIGLGAAALFSPRHAWAIRRDVLVCLVAAVVVAGVVLGYPTWFAVDGPRHIVGYPWPGTRLAGVQVSGIVNPGGLVHERSVLTEVAGYYGDYGPNSAYLGIPLLAFVAVSSLVWARRRLAWVLVVVATSSWLFAVGTVPSWGPWRAFQHVPVVSEITPSTFCTTLFFAAALLLALSADAWWRRTPSADVRDDDAHVTPRRLRGGYVRGVVVAVVAVGALAPVAATYSLPFVMHVQPEPAWFRQVAPKLPEGTVVLPYPFSGGQAMGWQAVAGMRYRIVGGFVIVPGQDGRHSSGVSPFTGTTPVLEHLSDLSVKVLPAATPATVRSVRSSLAQWGVQVVVVPMHSPGRVVSYAAAFFTAVLGRAPRQQAQAWVWDGLGTAPPLSVDPATVARCASARQTPRDAPDCVLDAASRRAVAATSGTGGS